MRQFSRAALCSALFSCAVHSLGLGLAASLIITSPPKFSPLVKVTFIQRPVPLPVGESGTGNAQEILPPRDSDSPPRPQPKSVVKPVVKKKSTPPPVAAPPTPIAKKTPPPASSVESTPQLALAATPSLPLELPASESDDFHQTGGPDGNVGNTPGSIVDEIGGNGRIPGRGNGAGIANGAGRGGDGGSSARPEYGVNPKPYYPLIARRLGAQGVVLLRVQVREDGSVANVELARSSGFAMLDESASRTIRESWRFIPARIDGIPVESWVEVPIKFVLEDS